MQLLQAAKLTRALFSAARLKGCLCGQEAISREIPWRKPAISCKSFDMSVEILDFRLDNRCSVAIHVLSLQCVSLILSWLQFVCLRIFTDQ